MPPPQDADHASGSVKMRQIISNIHLLALQPNVSKFINCKNVINVQSAVLPLSLSSIFSPTTWIRKKIYLFPKTKESLVLTGCMISRQR